jgi:hypothetical protein
MISVIMVDPNIYEVRIEGDPQTRHRVHMSQEYFRKLCGGTVTHEWVLMQAFKFLLEREPSTSILAEFDLADISTYFPEFEDEIKGVLAG